MCGTVTLRESFAFRTHFACPLLRSLRPQFGATWGRGSAPSRPWGRMDDAQLATALADGPTDEQLANWQPRQSPVRVSARAASLDFLSPITPSALELPLSIADRIELDEGGWGTPPPAQLSPRATLQATPSSSLLGLGTPPALQVAAGAETPSPVQQSHRVRRRLRCKTSPSEAYSPSICAHTVCQSNEPVALDSQFLRMDPCLESFGSQSQGAVQERSRALEVLRSFYTTFVWQAPELMCGEEEMSYRAKRRRQRYDWGRLSVSERLDVLDQFLEQRPPGTMLASQAEALKSEWEATKRVGRRSTKPGRKKKDCIRMGGHVLLTYQSTQWTLPVLHDYLDLDIAELCLRVRDESRAQSFWRKRMRSVIALKDNLSCSHLSLCVELCPRTWQEQGVIRLHLHVALQAGRRAGLVLDSLADLEIDDSIPHYSAQRSSSGQTRKVVSSAGACHYYCQIPKIGQVFMHCTTHAFHDFPVNPEWVTNFLQSEKITELVAREQYVRCGKNLAHHLSNLERVVMEKRRGQLEKKRLQISSVLEGEVRPFKYFPLVHENWLPVFKMTLSRYPFLVITGASCTGKTMYAKWLFGNPSKVYEVNCASTPEPDLRQFDSLEHEGILFDEAQPQMVCDQRKLFQGPPCWVDLGCSTTNCHKYQVFVSGIKMMICTNCWDEACEKLRHASDREWLRANGLVLKVGEPMWLDKAELPNWDCLEADS